MRYKNLDFLRTVFALIIVYFHILHAQIIPYTNENEIYLHLRSASDHAGLVVQCFFILSGYFLYQTIKNKSELTIKSFIIEKIVRLWPALAFSIMITVVVFKWDMYPSFFNLLFLQSNGIALESKGINWYISPLFWVMIFYFAMNKLFDRKKVGFVTAILVYFSYVFSLNYLEGGFGRVTVYHFINLGVLNAIAGIGLGYLIALGLEQEIHVRVAQRYQNVYAVVTRILFTAVECMALLFLLGYFLSSRLIYENHFIVVIMFSVLLVCFVKQKGLLSRFLNRDIFGVMGKYTYSIYVMQQVAFLILRRTFWRNTDFLIRYPFLSIGISLVFSVAVGVGTYYLVEAPVVRGYKKYLD